MHSPGIYRLVRHPGRKAKVRTPHTGEVVEIHARAPFQEQVQMHALHLQQLSARFP